MNTPILEQRFTTPCGFTLDLPSCWKANLTQSGDAIVTLDYYAVDGRLNGTVSVDEKQRFFALGHSWSPRRSLDAKIYKGQGWQERLYADAMQAILDVWSDAA